MRRGRRRGVRSGPLPPPPRPDKNAPLHPPPNPPPPPAPHLIARCTPPPAHLIACTSSTRRASLVRFMSQYLPTSSSWGVGDGVERGQRFGVGLGLE
jgi:hypothetical protein